MFFDIVVPELEGASVLARACSLPNSRVLKLSVLLGELARNGFKAFNSAGRPCLLSVRRFLPLLILSLSRRIHFYKGVFVENDIFAREFLRKMTFFQGSFGLNAHFKQDSTGRASASMEFLLKLS